MDFGDFFKNGCYCLVALSTAALTGDLVVSGVIWDRTTVLGAANKKLLCTRICVRLVKCVF
jgi:hypothetical protein